MKFNNTMKLTNEQLSLITNDDDYCLIVAGAGCGKTKTLVLKVKNLLKTLKPEEICLISFTNEAVKNLDTEIYLQCKKKVPSYTFHKLALKIINDDDFFIAPDNFLQQTIKKFFNEEYTKNTYLKNIIYAYFHIYGFKRDKRLQKKDKLDTYKLIETFLKLYLSNDFKKEDWYSMFRKKKYKKLLLIIYALYHYYEKEKALNNYIDFDDMLKIAIKKIQQKKIILPFKFILIDEFQDTSKLRFNLIREINKQTNCKILVVGDDYQSIFSFAGCDLELFLNFSSYYPLAKLYKLQKTFRNSYELIYLATKFVLKNPYQIIKDVQSDIKRKKPIKICYYLNEERAFKNIIKKIPKDSQVFVLGRNHFNLSNLKEKYAHYKNIRFLTIHASKGLEADYVIVLKVSDEKYGIPSKVKDEKILSLIKKEENYLYEEERRLFYVALTRAKKDVFLLVPKFSPSSFILEIKDEEEVEIFNQV